MAIYEVFYVAAYTEPNPYGASGAMPLEMVWETLKGTGADKANNVFQIGANGPATPGATAIDRIVSAIGTHKPTIINLVGHYGGSGLILHQPSKALGDILRQDLQSWTALTTIADSMTTQNLINSDTVIRLLGCGVLAPPACDTKADGPLMAHSMARALCCKIVASEQALGTTDFEKGKLSALGRAKMEAVYAWTALGPKQCCSSLPTVRAFLPAGPSIGIDPSAWSSAKAHLYTPVGQTPLSRDFLHELLAAIGIDGGVPERAPLVDVERMVVIESEEPVALRGQEPSQRIELVVIGDGSMVWVPGYGMIYPIQPEFAHQLTAGEATPEPKERGRRPPPKR
jgi:hypothetical protein